MRTRTRAVLLIAVIGLAVAGCGDDDSPTLHPEDDGSCADPAVDCPTTDVTDVTDP